MARRQFVARPMSGPLAIVRAAAISAILVALADCSLLPPTLATVVNRGATDYGQVMNQFSDKALLSNVLRAKNNLPLNFSDLSSITGSFSLQASLGLSLPLGSVPGAINYGSVSPELQTGSSPALTLGTLNTQGFIMTMIQPVSPMYVVSKWNDGYDKELLMYLFIKSVKFADGQKFLNNPDSKSDMAGFNRLIAEIVNAHVDLKTLTLLDPIGPPFPLARTAGPATSKTAGDETYLESLNIVKSIGGGVLHIGNAKCPFASEFGCVPLYKKYPAQVALCVDARFDPITDQYKFNDHVIFGANETLAQRRAEQAQPAVHPHLAAGRALLRAGTKMATGGSTGASSPPPAATEPGGAGGATPQVTASLQPSRASVVLGSGDCKPDEIVLTPETEEGFSAASSEFAQIEWRSISEAIQYLGAVARNQDRNQVPLWHRDDMRPMQTLITIVAGDRGLITVDYRGADYSVPGERRDPTRYPNDFPNDHGLQALAMLNELIGTAKISGNVPVPQPVQFVIP
jgi:hypothetical protein